MVNKKQLGLEGDLLRYIERRALRNKATLEQTLEHVIREAMRFDDLVTKMQENGSDSALRN